MENPTINGFFIRKDWLEGKMYYSIIDIIAQVRNTDQRHAQNYYHVLKNRLKKCNIEIPDLIKIRALADDNKMRLTDFTTTLGLKMLMTFIQPNIRNAHIRVNIRKDGEVTNLHPEVISLLEARGWKIEYHIKLPSGKIIDIVATYDNKTYVIECKSSITKTKLYQAIGQVLCYLSEYDETAIPMIAS